MASLTSELKSYVSNSVSLPYSVEALLLGRKRQISSSGEDAVAIIPDVVISEEHDDEVVVTRHPVDHGAAIADHAYKNPASLTVLFGWSDSSRLLNSALSGSILKGVSTTKEVYEQLLKLMNARELLSVSTGKRQYTNMLITRLKTTSTAETESCLMCEITFEEVILVQTAETTLSALSQKSPEKTASVTNMGQVQSLSGAPETPLTPEEATTYPVDVSI